MLQQVCGSEKGSIGMKIYQSMKQVSSDIFIGKEWVGGLGGVCLACLWGSVSNNGIWVLFQCLLVLVVLQYFRPQNLTKMKMYKCEACDKAFKYLSLYERHQRSHKDQRAYKCEHCDKSFNRPDTLKTHMNIHLGTGYSCCNRFFHSKAALKYHVRTSHKVEVIKCSECPMTFQNAEELKSHSETHKITEFPMLLDIIATEECSPIESNPDGSQGEAMRKSLVFVMDEFVKKHSFSFWSDSGMRMSFLKI